MNIRINLLIFFFGSVLGLASGVVYAQDVAPQPNNPAPKVPAVIAAPPAANNSGTPPSVANQPSPVAVPPAAANNPVAVPPAAVNTPPAANQPPVAAPPAVANNPVSSPPVVSSQAVNKPMVPSVQANSDTSVSVKQQVPEANSRRQLVLETSPVKTGDKSKPKIVIEWKERFVD